MSKASIKAKKAQEMQENKYRIANYGAYPNCGKGFVYFGLDASCCPVHGWIKDSAYLGKVY